MTALRGVGLTTAILTCLVGLAGPASAAALIKKQAPCVIQAGFCTGFSAGGVIPVIRSFSFNAPSAGTASVSFHGSMLCTSSSNKDPQVVDLASQIVTSSGAEPNPNGPGGLRHAVVLLPVVTGTTDTVNLASTRVLAIGGAGPRTFHFKLSKLRMDPSTACIVYNAAFSVIFVP
jgi:hypothetical protein